MRFDRIATRLSLMLSLWFVHLHQLQYYVMARFWRLCMVWFSIRIDARSVLDELLLKLVQSVLIARKYYQLAFMILNKSRIFTIFWGRYFIYSFRRMNVFLALWNILKRAEQKREGKQFQRIVMFWFFTSQQSTFEAKKFNSVERQKKREILWESPPFRLYSCVNRVPNHSSVVGRTYFFGK